MAIDGWVKVHRVLSLDPIWTAEPFTRGQAWIDLILLANHEPGAIRTRGVYIEIARGQVGWSEVRLAERWKWSRDKVRRWFSELEKREHKIIQQKNNVTSLITIVKYDLYQSDDTANNTPNDTAEKQQKNTKRYTNKNEKNEKNEKNKKNLYLDSVFLSDSELKKLQEKYGEEKTAKAIEVLNNGIMSKGYKYKSHYHTIIGWPMKEVNGNGKSGATGNTGQTTNQAGRAKSDGQPYPVDFQC